MTFLGVQGHLVTVTSVEEDDFLKSNFQNGLEVRCSIQLSYGRKTVKYKVYFYFCSPLLFHI